MRIIRAAFLPMLVALVAMTGLAGCADQMLSDGRIADSTATTIGTTPGNITISDRHSDVTNTTYTAQTAAGLRYTCAINGRGLLAAGMTNAPFCTKRQ
jgi:hypothetical protein